MVFYAVLPELLECVGDSHLHVAVDLVLWLGGQGGREGSARLFEEICQWNGHSATLVLIVSIQSLTKCLTSFVFVNVSRCKVCWTLISSAHSFLCKFKGVYLCSQLLHFVVRRSLYG